MIVKILKLTIAEELNKSIRTYLSYNFEEARKNHFAIF